jgi:hypothetical protein
MTAIEARVIDTAETAARACGVGALFPRNATSYIGHIDFYASHVTHGNNAALLRCLAVLGVSRDPWRDVETPSGPLRRATLRDLDGTQRGEVILGSEGGTASLSYGLSRPLACFEVR